MAGGHVKCNGSTARAGAEVLVIDADPAVHELLSRLLALEDIVELTALTAAAGLRTLSERRPDLVMLSVALPDAHGARTLQRIREVTDAPVIMVGEGDDDVAEASFLHAGADDYVTKPLRPQELVARVGARLRTAGFASAPPAAYADAVVELDRVSLEVRIAGRPASLSALELRLLNAFVDHPNEVLSADRILARVWGDASLPRERVKVYVAYLRDKFRRAGVDSPIETVRGFGYRYRPPAG